MKTTTIRPQVSVLVLGKPSIALRRANALRMRGFATWVATSEAELRWLLEVARIRPSYAVVDATNSDEGVDRVQAIVALANLAAHTPVPVVLVGAEAEEARFFRRIVAALPGNPGNTAIIAAFAGDSAA